MNKLVVITMLIGFFTSSYGSVSPVPTHETTNTQALVTAIKHAATTNEWKQYRPSIKCESSTQTLYFKKRINNKDLYKYQHRFYRQHTDLHVKVKYSQKNIDVEFVDPVSMNPGRLGVLNKANEHLQEFKKAIDLELAGH